MTNDLQRRVYEHKTGVIGEVEGMREEELVFGMIKEKPPQFIDAKERSTEELKKSFSDSISKFVTANFDLEKTKGLSLNRGKYKIWVQFTINEEGNIINLRARVSHERLEKHTIEILKRLPQFIPGKQRGKLV